MIIISSFILFQFFLKNSIPMPSCPGALFPVPLCTTACRSSAVIGMYMMSPLCALYSPSGQRTHHPLVSVPNFVSYAPQMCSACPLWSSADSCSHPGLRGSFDRIAFSVPVLDAIVTDSLPGILYGLLRIPL